MAFGFTFKRPVGAKADENELIYVSSLHQAGKVVRPDCSLVAEDVQQFLMSRYGIKVSETYVKETIIKCFGGDDGTQDGEEAIDVAELTAMLLIPFLLKVGKKTLNPEGIQTKESFQRQQRFLGMGQFDPEYKSYKREKDILEAIKPAEQTETLLHDVVVLICDDLGIDKPSSVADDIDSKADITGTVIDRAFVRRLLNKYGEDDVYVNNDIVDEMVLAATNGKEDVIFDQVSLARALTDDVMLYDTKNETKLTTNFYDVFGTYNEATFQEGDAYKGAENLYKKARNVTDKTMETPISATATGDGGNGGGEACSNKPKINGIFSFQVGECVVLHGLIGSPELNGRPGIIVGYDSSQDRYSVDMDPPETSDSTNIIAVKPTHLNSCEAAFADSNHLNNESSPTFDEDDEEDNVMDKMELDKDVGSDDDKEDQSSSSSSTHIIGQDSGNIKTVFTAPAIDYTSDMFRSKALTVALYVFALLTMYTYIVPGYRQIDAFNFCNDDTRQSLLTFNTDSDDKDSSNLIEKVADIGFGCQFFQSIFDWFMAAIIYSIFGLTIITIGSVGNFIHSDGSSRRYLPYWITSFIIILVLTFLPFGLRNKFKDNPVQGILVFVTLLMGLVLMFLQGIQIFAGVRNVSGKENEKKPLPFSRFFTPSLLVGQSDIKQASAFKTNRMILNALKIHDIQKTGDTLLDYEKVAGESLETTGGLFWTYNNIFFTRKLLNREGIWYNGRLVIGNILQLLITIIIPLLCGYLTKAIGDVVKDKVEKYEDFGTIGFIGATINPYQQLFDTLEDAALSIQTAGYIGSVVAFLSCVAITLLYFPSVTNTILQLRSGLITNIHDHRFQKYRAAQDSVSQVIGAMAFGTVVSGIVVYLAIFFVCFLFLWNVTRNLAFRIAASITGSFVVVGLKIAILMIFIRRNFYRGFYRSRPAAANMTVLALECVNIALSLVYMITRALALMALSAFYMGRIDVPMLEEGVGEIGPMDLDRFPGIFRRDLLAHEAHRHPYLETIGVMYMMKLRHGEEFGKRSGAVWRLLFVYALMPWLRKYREQLVEGRTSGAEEPKRLNSRFQSLGASTFARQESDGLAQPTGPLAKEDNVLGEKKQGIPDALRDEEEEVFCCGYKTTKKKQRIINIVLAFVFIMILIGIITLTLNRGSDYPQELSPDVLAFSMAAAKLSLVVYDDPTSTTFPHYNEEVSSAEWRVQGADVAFVVNIDNTCYVTFRGTKSTSLRDQLTNLDRSTEQICTQKNTTNCCDGRGGFIKAFMKEPFHQNLELDIQNCRESCLENIGATEMNTIDQEPKERSCNVVITGHSQGGAIASVASVKWNHLNPVVITFGQPSTLDEYCLNIVNSKATYRWINTDTFFNPKDVVNGIATVEGLLVYDPIVYVPKVDTQHYGNAIVMNESPESVAFYKPDEHIPIQPIKKPYLDFNADQYTYLDLDLSAHSMLNYTGRIQRLVEESEDMTLNTGGFGDGYNCRDDSECSSGTCKGRICV